jgi:threonine synthase
VPSGNLGNLTAGLLAERMGLPVRQFVAALNANDAIGPYLGGAPYQPRPSITTHSNAMDVGAPSNFARLLDLFGRDRATMAARVTAITVGDEATLTTIREVKSLHDYAIDPHGAVAWLGAKAWRALHPCSSTITLETAHPAKFPDVMDAELGKGVVEIPERLAILAAREKAAVPMGTCKAAFRDWLVNTLR